MNQLCKNLMGHLNSKGFYPILQVNIKWFPVVHLAFHSEADVILEFFLNYKISGVCHIIA